MIRRLFIFTVVLAAVAASGFWFITIPDTIAQGDLPDHSPNIENGAYIFTASGCGSCHAAPGAKGDDKLKLSGGVKLSTPFGVFHTPNISPDPDHGIGEWTLAEFVTSMKRGIGRQKEYLYPAFPYTSYQRMRIEDIIDLKAYIDTLPTVASSAPPHELSFPFNIRRGLGLWQYLYADAETFAPDPDKSDIFNRGAYLVGGPGHCGECHSPRNLIGGIVEDLVYSGGPSPEGDGKIPNITSDPATGIGDWSEDELIDAFATGFKPDFDTFGSTMAAVQANLAKLSTEDQAAIALFVKSLPPIASTSK